MTNRMKQKGKSWERKVAAILSEKIGEHFGSVPNSGAAVGGLNAQNLLVLDKSQAMLLSGDILKPPKYCNVLIECKNYSPNQFKLHLFLTPNHVLFDSFVQQTEETNAYNLPVFFFLKLTDIGEYIIYPDQYDFDHSDNYIHYKKWILCDLKYFFSKIDNINLIKSIWENK